MIKVLGDFCQRSVCEVRIFLAEQDLDTLLDDGSRNAASHGASAQNANLAAQGMGLATTNIGGYADRLVDRYLDLDGLNESTVYVLLIGEAVSGEAR